MRVEIKELKIEGGRPQWRPLSIDGLIGKSVVDYMLDTSSQVIAALYPSHDKDAQPIAFVSNHITLVDKYQEKGVSMHAREVKDLLGTTLVPPIIAYSLGGEIVEIKSHKEVTA